MNHAKQFLNSRYLHMSFLIVSLLGIAGCGPDLTITQGSFTPSSPAEGDVMNITLTVKNIGTKPVNNAKISIFFELPGTAYGPPSNLLPTVTLLPGAQTNVSFQWKLQQGWGNKSVHLFAEADVGDNVSESNEQNNRFDFGNLLILPVRPPN